MALWDIRALFYDQARNVFPINLIYRKEMKNVGLLVSKIGKKDATVLDVASGTGAVISLFPATWIIFRADSSLAMLKKAELKSIAVGADCNQLPFKPAAFNVITAVGLLEYLKRPANLFKHLQSITSDGAKIIFTYAQHNLLNLTRNLLGHRLYFHNMEDLQHSYAEAGFEMETQLTSLIQTQVLLKKV